MNQYDDKSGDHAQSSRDLKEHPSFFPSCPSYLRGKKCLARCRWRDESVSAATSEIREAVYPDKEDRAGDRAEDDAGDQADDEAGHAEPDRAADGERDRAEHRADERAPCEFADRVGDDAVGGFLLRRLGSIRGHRV